MLYFNCDYTEGAHPRVLEKMLETNLEQTVGYGEAPPTAVITGDTTASMIKRSERLIWIRGVA